MFRALTGHKVWVLPAACLIATGHRLLTQPAAVNKRLLTLRRRTQRSDSISRAEHRRRWFSKSRRTAAQMSFKS